LKQKVNPNSVIEEEIKGRNVAGDAVYQANKKKQFKVN
jgi:hypothetical protein